MSVEVAEPRTVLLAEIGERPARWRRGAINWPLTIGLTLLGLIVIACLIGPFLVSNPDTQNLLLSAAPPFTPGHLLGTDAPYGRDVLSRLLNGGRYDLLIGFGGTGVTIIVGSFIGLLAGYYG